MSKYTAQATTSTVGGRTKLPPKGHLMLTEKEILRLLEKPRTWAVPWLDGLMLRILAESIKAQFIVEIGTGCGVSTLWFCLALRNTKGRIMTFERDPLKIQMAEELFGKAKVGKMVTLVQGNAHDKVLELREALNRAESTVDPKTSIDLVLLDADKKGYVDYLDQLLPWVRPGGLVLAHNTNMPSVAPYMEAVRKNPQLETVEYQSGESLSISLKKRQMR